MKLPIYNKRQADRLALLLIFSLFWGSISSAFVSPHHAEASAVSGPTVVGATYGVYASAGATASQGITPVTVDANLNVVYDQSLNGATVVINNFKNGDSLSLDAALAQSYGITVDNQSAAIGLITLKSSGTASVLDYQSLLRTVTYSTTSTDISDRAIVYSMGSALPYNGTGHYYEYIAQPAINWNAAVTAASGQSYFGREGYLATITSQGENDFITQKTSGVGWIGAEDIGRKNGESATNNPAAGDWRWVTGPEGLEDGGSGMKFWNGYTSGTSVNGAFKNWKSGEPNNYSGVEYVAHIFAGSGLWNDYSPGNTAVQGYVIEYGGMPNDDTSIQISTTKTIIVPGPVLTSTVFHSDDTKGTTLTLTFNEDVQFGNVSTSTNGFTVMINGQPVAVQTADASGNKVTLTLPNGLNLADLNKVSVTYTRADGSLQGTNGAGTDDFTANVIDKTALRAAVTDNESLNAVYYTPTSWEALKQALVNAKAVLADPNAAQDQVDAALAELNAARQALVKKATDDQLVQLDVTGHTANGDAAINLAPAFSPDFYSMYKATVSNSTYGMSIAPIAASADRDVRVALNGSPVDSADWNSLPLIEGRNVIKTGVYAKDGTLLNEYEVEIIRTTDKLAALQPTAGSLSPAFDPMTTEYSLSVSNAVYSMQWTPAALDPNAKIEISVNDGAWQQTASGGLSPELPLNVGMNKIVVKVTGADGQVKMYTINVMRNGFEFGSGSGTVGTPTTTPDPASDVKTTVNNSDSSFATGTTAGNDTNVAIDNNKLSDYLSKGNGQQLNVIVPGDGNIKVEGLTAATLKQLSDTGSTLNIENLLAIYPVPSKQLDLGSVTKQWSSAPLGDIAVHIDIKRSSEALNAAAKDQAAKGGYDLLVNPVDLSLSFTYQGQTIKPDQLAGYAPRYIALPEGIDPNKITTGVIVNPDGTVFHVPTVVTKINNRYFALINDLRSQGSYSVIWNPQNFDDVKNHWAQKSVNNIAARLQLQGTGNNTFSPNRSIDRSEFATIVASGLGLMRQGVSSTPYSDVATSSWYHDAVTIASEFGIIKGFADDKFHGTELITREQGIAMIARALHVVEPQKTLSEAEINQILAPYGDMDEISGYARESAAQLIKAGILQGKDGQQLKPKATMTRAETAALVERLLKHTKLID